jgi:hypothetical protein
MDVWKNCSIILANTLVGLDDPRPLLPSVIPIGGMHIAEQPEPLPKVVIITLWNWAKFSNTFAHYVHAVLGTGEESLFWNFSFYRQMTQIPKHIHRYKSRRFFCLE